MEQGLPKPIWLMIMQELDVPTLLTLPLVCRGFDRLTRNNTCFARHVKRILLAMPVLETVFAATTTVSHGREIARLLRNPNSHALIQALFDWSSNVVVYCTPESVYFTRPWANIHTLITIHIKYFHYSCRWPRWIFQSGGGPPPLCHNEFNTVEERVFYARARYRAILLGDSNVPDAWYII